VNGNISIGNNISVNNNNSIINDASVNNNIIATALSTQHLICCGRQHYKTREVHRK